MKKLVLLLITLLVVSGCGKKSLNTKELKCTKSFSDAISSITYENKYVYENNNLKNVTTDSLQKFTDDGISNLETFKTYIEATKDEYNKKNGVKATLKYDDSSINIIVNYDISNMDADVINNYGYNVSLNDLRNNMEKIGYTCK